MCESFTNTAFMLDVQNESHSSCVDMCVGSRVTNEVVTNNVDVVEKVSQVVPKMCHIVPQDVCKMYQKM